MLQKLGKPTVLISSLVLTAVMFVIVMFFVNPSIDGKDGAGVLQLQLAFEKKAAIALVEGWGESGIENFRKWIFTDYIYAFSYAWFFASLISYLALKQRQDKRFATVTFIGLALLSGILDCIENSIELFFLRNPDAFSANLFFAHSLIASLKWAAVALVIFYILVLLTKMMKSIRKGRSD